MHFLSLKKLNTRTIKRSTVAGIIIILAFSALVFRIFWLQTAGFEKYQELVIDQMTTESAVKATRGKIYDKNGKVLATSITAYRVFISPRGIATAQKNLEDGKREIKEDTLKTDNYAELISANLADILGVSYAKVKTMLLTIWYISKPQAKDIIRIQVLLLMCSALQATTVADFTDSNLNITHTFREQTENI